MAKKAKAAKAEATVKVEVNVNECKFLGIYRELTQGRAKLKELEKSEALKQQEVLQSRVNRAVEALESLIYQYEDEDDDDFRL